MPVTSRNMAQVTPMNEKIMADTDVKTKTAAMLNRQGQLYVQDYCNKVESPVSAPVESKGRRGFKDWNGESEAICSLALPHPPKFVFLISS